MEVRARLSRIWRRFIRWLDPFLSISFVLGLGLIFIISSLAFRRGGVSFLDDIDLRGGFLVNYGIEGLPDKLFPPLDPSVIADTRQDVKTLAKDTGNSTHIDAVTASVFGEPTASPSPTATVPITPTLVGAGMFVEIEGPDEGDEGEERVFHAFMPPQFRESFVFTWDLDGDGRFDDEQGNTISLSFNDEGEYPIAVEARNVRNDLVTAQKVITIHNVAPTVTIGGNFSGLNEGSPVSFRSTAIDPGSDVLTFEWDFGDGIILRGPANPTHTFADDGVYQVVLRVDDNDGGQGEDRIVVTVNDVLPTVVLGPDRTTNEGETIEVSAIVTDPGDDVLSFAWDFDYSGSGFDVQSFGLNAVVRYDDGDSEHTVGFRARDEDDNETIATLKVTVLNVAPTIVTVRQSAPPYREGETLALTVDATDPGNNDTLTFAVDWDDDGEFDQEFSRGPLGDPVRFEYIPLDNGRHEVLVRVTDKDGASDERTAVFNVENQRPSITSVTVSPTPGKEGQPVTLSATATDPGQNDILTYRWSFPDTQTSESGANVQHIFGDNNVYTVTLTVSDDDGASVKRLVPVTVENVPPQVFLDPLPAQVNEGQVMTLKATATDVPSDPLTFEWELAYQDHPVHNTVLTGPTVDHLVPDGNDTLVVILRVRDDDGGVTEVTPPTVQVLNVPPAITGFAVSPNPALEGQTVSVTGAATDVAADTISYFLDLDGDGNFEVGPLATVEYPHKWGRGPNWPAPSQVYNVKLKAVDEDGGETVALPIDVTVNNAPPTAVIGGPKSVNEGSAITLDGSGSTDPVPDDQAQLLYAWDLDNNGTYETPSVSAVFPLTLLNGCAACQYAVHLRVDDQRGGIGNSTAVISVINVAPTAVISSSGNSITKSTTMTLDGRGSNDPGPDTLTFAWDLDYDGVTFTVDKSGSVITASWSVPGAYTVALRVDDGDGGRGLVTKPIVVSNPTPTAEAGGPYTGDEGVPLTLDGSGSSDPQGDSLTFEWDLNYDGVTFTPDVITTSLTISYAFPDGDFNYQAALRVKDSWGAASPIDTASVTINNVPPAIQSMSVPSSTQTLRNVPLSATASDVPADLPTLVYEWDLDYDGVTFTVDRSGQNVNASWTSPGTYVVGLRVRDKELAYSVVMTRTIIVNDGKPINVNAGGPYTGNEGIAITLSGSATDPQGDALTYAWDLDYDGVTFNVDASGASPSVTFPDGPLNRNIGLRATDSWGNFAIATTTVTINNVAPVINSMTVPASAQTNQQVTLTASASDVPGDLSNASYAWDPTYNGVTFNPVQTGQTITVTWPASATYTVALQVTDKDGGQALDTRPITVSDGTPTSVNAGGPYSGSEGTDVGLSGSATDPQGDPLTYAWDLDYDGVTFNVDVTGPSPAYVWPDNMTKTVALRATDSWGNFNVATTTVTLSNVAPTINSMAVPASAQTNQQVTLSASAGDAAGDQPTLTYSWDLDYDGATFNVDATGATVNNATWATTGTYTVALRVADKDGGQSLDTRGISINDGTPTNVNAGGPYSGSEGTDVGLSGSATDPQGDPLTFAWDLDGDGLFDDATGATPAFVWPDDTNGTLTLQASDIWGNAATATAAVTITNVAPVINTMNVPNAAQTNQQVTLSASASDVPADVPDLLYEWDPIYDGTYDPILFGASVTYSWPATGTYTVRMRVDDQDGGSVFQSKLITINSGTPTNVDAGGPYTGNEGASVGLSGSATDPQGDALTYTWDLDGDGLFDDASGPTPAFVWPDNITLTISMRATDPWGNFGTDTASVTINNVAPTANAGGPYTTTLANPINLTASSTDPAGANDPPSYTWDLNNDGTFETPGNPVVYSPTATGTFVVTVRVDDGDGGSGLASTTVTVNP